MKNDESKSLWRRILEHEKRGPVLFIVGVAIGYFLVHGFLYLQTNYLWVLFYR